MRTLNRSLVFALVVGVSTAACERPPVDSVQTGFRGVGLVHVDNPRGLAERVEAASTNLPDLSGPNDFTYAPPAPEGTFQNVQVLGHLSEIEFNRTMLALTSWVAAQLPADTPNDGRGCNFCHVVENGVANYASDAIYTKVAARRMLQMTQAINSEYSAHVNEGGVNCYTCHLGAPVPANIWFYTDVNQPLRHYLDRDDLRVQSGVALTSESDNRTSIKQTEYAYSLMLNMSGALGVNCTYCHNSARWGSWEDSSPQRLTALRGLRMIRDVNMQYIVPLQPVWPDNRLGPLGDGPKAECATCHNGAYVPLYGSPVMRATGWPGLYPAPEGLGVPAPMGEDTPSEGGMGAGQ
jgi:photosynthetic reaction center cytochrome c subunit